MEHTARHVSHEQRRGHDAVRKKFRLKLSDPNMLPMSQISSPTHPHLALQAEIAYLSIITGSATCHPLGVKCSVSDW